MSLYRFFFGRSGFSCEWHAPGPTHRLQVIATNQNGPARQRRLPPVELTKTFQTPRVPQWPKKKNSAFTTQYVPGIRINPWLSVYEATVCYTSLRHITVISPDSSLRNRKKDSSYTPFHFPATEVKISHDHYFTMSKADRDRAKAMQEKYQAILSNFLKDEDNKYCVDCDAKGEFEGNLLRYSFLSCYPPRRRACFCLVKSLTRDRKSLICCIFRSLMTPNW